MALLTLMNAQLAFGHVPLLDCTDFSLEARERVGLIGRNGTGKSSLLKVLAGLDPLDDGSIAAQKGVQVAYVPQEPALDDTHTVFQAAALGVQGVAALRERYLGGSVTDPDALDALQSAIEAGDGWNWERRVEEALQRLDLSPDHQVGDLSGGTRKRVALAQALVARPDILLLDEPTNHLDLASITWLQELLVQFSGSVVVISHDRAFLDAVATRIVELDRGRLRSYPGSFSQYQAAKEAQLSEESVVQAKADKLLAQEEIWVRKGVEARRTRSQSRIARLEGLRAARQARRDTLGQVKLGVARGDLGGKVVAELEGVGKSYGERAIVRDFTATVLRGDKVGLVGSNGTGKTTLLRLILGQVQPDAGRVRQGTNLQVAYFDQMRDGLDLNATLEDFISPGSEWIEIGTQRKHVKSYLDDFLFSPARAQSPVRSLSGGERNRLLLARLFARPANVLVLDEPTNDLDIDTLELLESLLQDYAGTVFVVSHDRTFLDNVVTSTIVHEGGAHWREYEGGVQDWLLQSQRARDWAASTTDRSPAPPPPAAASSKASAPLQADSAPVPTRRKLSYKDQRELDGLPERIAALEAEQASLRHCLADGSLYRSDPSRAQELTARDAAIETELMATLERWESLTA